ncbi:MAG: nucleoside-diphosphate kinase [bacterium]
MERTLVFVKPDGVKRGLVGKILARFEEKGIKLVALRQLEMDAELCDKHYIEHVEQPFYPNLKAYILSGPIVAMVLEAEKVVSMVRLMVGATDAAEAAPGTLRGDFAISKSENIVHASDSVASANREIANFFE